MIVFFPDASPAHGVEHADDLLCHELCARVGALDRAEAALEGSAQNAGELGAAPGTLAVAGRGFGAAVAAVLALARPLSAFELPEARAA